MLAKAVFLNGKITMCFFLHIMLSFYLNYAYPQSICDIAVKQLHFSSVLLISLSTPVHILFSFWFSFFLPAAEPTPMNSMCTHTHMIHTAHSEMVMFLDCVNTALNFLVRLDFEINFLGLKFSVCIWQDNFLLSR